MPIMVNRLAAALLLCASTAFGQTSTEAVAAVMIGEAGGEGIAGMQAVLNVIDNRAVKFHKSRLAVISQPKQFSCLNHTSLAALVRRAKQHARWPEALKLSAQAKVPDITHGALFYHERWLSPSWARRMVLTLRLGNHRFYS